MRVARKLGWIDEQMNFAGLWIQIEMREGEFIVFFAGLFGLVQFGELLADGWIRKEAVT